jgi:hypothetical protein
MPPNFGQQGPPGPGHHPGQNPHMQPGGGGPGGPQPGQQQQMMFNPQQFAGMGGPQGGFMPGAPNAAGMMPGAGPAGMMQNAGMPHMAPNGQSKFSSSIPQRGRMAFVGPAWLLVLPWAFLSALVPSRATSHAAGRTSSLGVFMFVSRTSLGKGADDIAQWRPLGEEKALYRLEPR